MEILFGLSLVGVIMSPIKYCTRIISMWLLRYVLYSKSQLLFFFNDTIRQRWIQCLNSFCIHVKNHVVGMTMMLQVLFSPSCFMKHVILESSVLSPVVTSLTWFNLLTLKCQMYLKVQSWHCVAFVNWCMREISVKILEKKMHYCLE